MESILEALAENRLNAFDDQLPKTEAYKELEAQRDSCVERYVNVIGEKNRPILDQFLAFLLEENRWYARESFLSGFRLGALSTIEAYINREKFIVSAENQQADSALGTAERSPTEQGYQDLILKALAEGEIITYSPEQLANERTLHLDIEHAKYHDILISKVRQNDQDFSEVDAELTAINTDISQLECNSRFTHNYGLGVLMITDIFQGREKLIAD